MNGVATAGFRLDRSHSLARPVFMSFPQVRVAVVQAEVAANHAAGLEMTASLTMPAASQGAALVVFPETWLPGYPAWLDWCRDVALRDHAPAQKAFRQMAAASAEVAGASGQALSQIAADPAVTLVVGVVERVAVGPGQGTLDDSLPTYGPDGTLRNHCKLVPTCTERMLFGPGDTTGLQAVDTPVGRLGGLVCWERWVPIVRQALHESGEEIHVAVWPTVHEIHQAASRPHAFEGRCFVLAAELLLRANALPAELEVAPDRVQDSQQWALRGGSAIIGPDGMYVLPPHFDAPGLLVADLDLGRCREEAMTLDVTGHDHRPDCFEFRTIATTCRN